MGDMERLDNEVRIIAEFGDVSDGTSYVEHGMAREIMRLRELAIEERATVMRQAQELQRLRRILAALREPSEAVQKAALAAWWEAPGESRGLLVKSIRAAVAAAEQEVDRG